MSSIDRSLHDLTVLRIQAQIYQDKTGTTMDVVPLSIIERGLHTTRDTISLVLVDHNMNNPRFALFREPVPGLSKQSTHRRLAVFGGGMRSVQEERIAALANKDPDTYFPELTDEKGNLRADAYYNILGKGLLRTGRLPDMMFQKGAYNMRRNLNRELKLRLKTEIGEQTTRITSPRYLRGMEPRITNVKGRTVGQYTNEAAKKHNLLLDSKGQIADLCISVRERFAWAFAHVDKLAANDPKIRVFDINGFIEFLKEQITDDVQDWLERSNVHEDSIRNDSTIFAVTQTIEELQSPLVRLRKRWDDWLHNRRFLLQSIAG